jgi:hypothetical protein
MKAAWNRRWKFIVGSGDFLSGLAVFGASLGAALSSAKLREPHIFDVTVGISVAILAVVLAAFAILAAFLTDEYTIVIEKTLGDTRRAFEPYAVVAIVAGAATFGSVAGIFLWPVLGATLKALLIAVALGLTCWSVVGSVQLVGITAHHGRMRLRVPEIRAAAREARQKEIGSRKG